LYKTEFRTENDKKILLGILDDYEMPKLKEIEEYQLEFKAISEPISSAD
jgi:hypothetical protein